MRQHDQTPTMHELLDEQLDHLRSALHEGETLQRWYEEGAEFALLNLGDDNHREACAFALGYLRGAAELADLTIEQLLVEHGCTFDAIVPTIRHYKSEDGICGYKLGDLLVNDTTGEVVEVVKDARGLCLKPASRMAVATKQVTP